MARKYSSSAVLAVTVALAVVLVATSTAGPSSQPQDGARPGATIAVSLCILGTSVLAIGLVRRDRARYRAALQAKEVERALAAERLAIARDLHDIVSHGLGLMTMRASVAALVDGEDAGALRSALQDVEAVSRSTTLEMRRMVRVLRGDAGSSGTDSAPREPLPGIESIGGLVERARASGLDVTFAGEATAATSEGEGVAANSAGVDVAAYRIVQEALGNAARHAGPCKVRVGLSRQEEVLVVSVTDDGGAGRRLSGAGHGLSGADQLFSSTGQGFDGAGQLLSGAGQGDWSAGRLQESLAAGNRDESGAGADGAKGMTAGTGVVTAGAEGATGEAGSLAGSPAPQVGAGNGLKGLGERVAALAGQFDFGPRPRGGFRRSVKCFFGIVLRPAPARRILRRGKNPRPANQRNPGCPAGQRH